MSNLTDRAIAQLVSPTQGRVEVLDATMPGQSSSRRAKEGRKPHGGIRAGCGLDLPSARTSRRRQRPRRATRSATQSSSRRRRSAQTGGRALRGSPMNDAPSGDLMAGRPRSLNLPDCRRAG